MSSRTHRPHLAPAAGRPDVVWAGGAALLDALPVGIALFGADGVLLRANAACDALVDAAVDAAAAPAAAAPRTLACLLAPALAPDVLAFALRQAARGERAGPLPAGFATGGSRVDVTLAPAALPDGARGTLLVLSPASTGGATGTTAEGVVTGTRERRLAAVGQLAAGVMHDVSNALNPIAAAAHLLEIHAADPRAVRDYARRITLAVETGAATAARMGRFIRPDAPAGAEPLADLGMIADDVVEMTRPTWTTRAGGPVDLAFESRPGILVRGCAGELREALLNLVQNALDAMPGGGRLGVHLAACGDAIALEVRDTGAGMSGRVRERAREPFFTTKGMRGTGLGLAQVEAIMQRHDGRLELLSAPGRGTVARLVFPRPAAVAVMA